MVPMFSVIVVFQDDFHTSQPVPLRGLYNCNCVSPQWERACYPISARIFAVHYERKLNTKKDKSELDPG
jgi:hypothetical protein